MDASNGVRSTIGGAVAGLGAGVALAIFLGLVGLASGEPFTLGAQVFGYGIWGDAVRTPGAPQVAAGYLLLLAVSMLLGILYGWVIRGQPRGLTLMGGVSWGALAWAVLTWGLAPAVGAGDFIQATIPLGRQIVSWVVWGMVLSMLFLPFQRRSTSPGRIPAPRRPTAGI